MIGKIIKGIAGFYYVHVIDLGIVECKAKGIFRNKKIKPLVGDNVEIEIIDQERRLGNIIDILPRKNELIRPLVANVDQALIIFAVTLPDPNFNLLSRFILMMSVQNIETVICFNKMELISKGQQKELENIYSHSGCKIIFSSTYNDLGMESIRTVLQHKTTVFAGPSGVGKSSITNMLMPHEVAQTGGLSEKIGRGKNTTRHSEIFHLGEDSYFLDTPGFTSLSAPDIEKEELHYYVEEFLEYEDRCRFHGCLHVSEPNCAVKHAVELGEINKIRYENYLEIFNELKNKKRY